MSDGAHRFSVRVYYEDTDFSGVVYHARYLQFLERARTERLRAAGIDQRGLFEGRFGPSIGLVVARMSLEFRRPAQMDDWLDVETVTLALTGASLRLGQRILRESTVLVEAEVTIAAISAGRATRLPPALVAVLRPAHGSA